jgi:hypothetical protein
MKTKSILFLTFLFISLYSCSKSEEFRFTLYLENTGSIPNCKTIKVTLDGTDIFTNQLCAAGVSPNVTTISFDVKGGNHKMKAEIIEDSKVFDQVTDFSDTKKFGYLTYNNNSSEFTFFLNSTGGID